MDGPLSGEQVFFMMGSQSERDLFQTYTAFWIADHIFNFALPQKDGVVAFDNEATH